MINMDSKGFSKDKSKGFELLLNKRCFKKGGRIWIK